MLIKIIVIFMIMTFAITELPYFNAKKKRIKSQLSVKL